MQNDPQKNKVADSEKDKEEKKTLATEGSQSKLAIADKTDKDATKDKPAAAKEQTEKPAQNQAASQSTTQGTSSTLFKTASKAQLGIGAN